MADSPVQSSRVHYCVETVGSPVESSGVQFCVRLVMCKGLSTLQGSGVRVRRIRVRVRTLWPSTNPWLLSRVRGFPRVFQGFHFSYIKVQIKFKQCWIGENIIQRGLTTFATLNIVQNALNPSYFINNLLKNHVYCHNYAWMMYISKLSLYLFTTVDILIMCILIMHKSRNAWEFLETNLVCRDLCTKSCIK